MRSESQEPNRYPDYQSELASGPSAIIRQRICSTYKPVELAGMIGDDDRVAQPIMGGGSSPSSLLPQNPDHIDPLVNQLREEAQLVGKQL